MIETIKSISYLIIIFSFGIVVGFGTFYLHTRISNIEAQQAMFQKNVEGFAKQVNDEFAKFRVKPEGKK